MSQEKKEKPKQRTTSDETSWKPDESQFIRVELGEPPKKKKEK